MEIYGKGNGGAGVMDAEQIEKSYEAMLELAYKLGQTIDTVLRPFKEALQSMYDGLEPYQKYEIMHPKKKPRGNKRRARE